MSDEEEGSESSGGGWLVSYADLMTLLFAAFVVLYGTITAGTNPMYLGIAASIRESFVDVSAKIKSDQLQDVIREGKYIYKAVSGETFTKKAPKQYVIKDHAFAKIDQDRMLVESFLDQLALDKGSTNFKLRKSMQIVPNEKGFTIKLAGAYFYSPNQYRINRNTRKKFLKLGTFLKKLDQDILIEGHAHKEGTNQFSSDEIASLRASNAARTLINRIGFNSHRLDTISYKNTRPISNTKKSDKNESNRRIELKIKY